VGRLVAGISDDTALANVLVSDAKRDASLAANEFDEVDDLSLVGLRVAIGEGVGDVVRNDASVGGEDHGGLGVVVSFDHALRAHDFDALIVTVLCVSVEINGGGDARRELQHDHDGVIIVERFNFREPGLARGVDLNGVLTNEPTVNVDIVRAAIVEDAARGLQKFKGRKWMVAAGCTHDLHLANVSIDNRLFQLHEGRVKTTLEATQEGQLFRLG